jgi:hypothetical protein
LRRAFLQVLQEGLLRAATEVLFQLHYTHSPVCSLVGDWNKTTSLPFFECHLRNHRDAGIGGHHCQYRGKLPAFKNYVRLQSRPAARCQRVLTKAMSLLEQQKGIAFNFLEPNL